MTLFEKGGSAEKERNDEIRRRGEMGDGGGLENLLV